MLSLAVSPDMPPSGGLGQKVNFAPEPEEGAPSFVPKSEEPKEQRTLAKVHPETCPSLFSGTDIKNTPSTRTQSIPVLYQQCQQKHCQIYSSVPVPNWSNASLPVGQPGVKPVIVPSHQGPPSTKWSHQGPSPVSYCQSSSSDLYTVISPQVPSTHTIVSSGVYERRIYAHQPSPSTLVRASSTSTALPVINNSSSSPSLNLRAGSLAGASLGNLSGPLIHGASEDHYSVARPSHPQYHHFSSSQANHQIQTQLPSSQPPAVQSTLDWKASTSQYPVVVQDSSGQRYMISRRPGSPTLRREEIIPAPSTTALYGDRRARTEHGWKGVQRALYQCAVCCVKCLGPV